jgi:putative ABC transport system substrate-binding protein
MSKMLSIRTRKVLSGNRKSKIQNRKWAGFLVILGLLVGCVEMANAQRPEKIHRVAVLSPGTQPRPVIEAFKQGLRDLGYGEGKNVTFEYRYADLKLERLPELAGELVRLKPDVIFVHSVTAAQAVKRATTTIPVVVAAAGDLVQDGIVTNLARPGGNITGLTLLSPELDGKRLELLKETARKVSRVAVLVNSGNPGWQRYPQDLEAAGRALGLRLQRAEVSGPADFERAFSTMQANGINGVLVVTDSLFQRYARQIAELAIKHRLPSISEVPEFAEAGGLIQYGLSISDLGRQSAAFVAKILKGAMPGDLPVERPTKFEFVINLKTAKAIGLTVPSEVLMRAEKVIK